MFGVQDKIKPAWASKVLYKTQERTMHLGEGESRGLCGQVCAVSRADGSLQPFVLHSRGYYS